MRTHMQAWNLSERVNEPYIFECELDKPSKHHNFLFFVSFPSLSLSIVHVQKPNQMSFYRK